MEKVGVHRVFPAHRRHIVHAQRMVHPRILFGRQRGFKACFGVINTYIVTDLTLNVNLFVTIAFALAAIPFLRKAGANTVSSRYGRFDGQSVAGARKYGE